jgi:PadR family transcriptional regulator AphA
MKTPQSRYAVLGMLSIKPMSGYDIKRMIEGSVSYFWTESFGQIYPMLKRLMAEELVVRTVERQRGKPDRHVYEVTPAGRQALRAWLAEGATPRVERNELLLKLFFGNQVPPTVSLEHVERFRERQRTLLRQYRQIEKQITTEHPGDPGAPYWLMTLRYGQHVSEALVRWCDESLANLSEMGSARRRPKGRKSRQRGTRSAPA